MKQPQNNNNKSLVLQDQTSYFNNMEAVLQQQNSNNHNYNIHPTRGHKLSVSQAFDPKERIESTENNST